MSAFTYAPKPKSNAEPKTCTNWILFFSVSVAEFQEIRQVILIKGHFTYTPKPNRNRTEKIKCIKPYGRFHICAETETETKPNAEPKTCTNLILFFSVSVAEFQQIRQVVLMKSAHTQPRALY